MPYNGKDDIVRDGIRNGRDGHGQSRKPRKRMGVKLIPLYLAAVGCVVLFSWVVSGKEGSKKPDLGYEGNAVVVTSEEELQKQVEEMESRDGKISLEYKNVAISGNGTDFDCYIANSVYNTGDMYIGIYTDATYEEELYLTQLIKPGSGITSFECNKKLEPGHHDAVLLFTLVEDDHKTIRTQTPVTYSLNVDG